jgi:hypothetical protein
MTPLNERDGLPFARDLIVDAQALRLPHRPFTIDGPSRA